MGERFIVSTAEGQRAMYEGIGTVEELDKLIGARVEALMKGLAKAGRL